MSCHDYEGVMLVLFMHTPSSKVLPEIFIYGHNVLIDIKVRN